MGCIEGYGIVGSSGINTETSKELQIKSLMDTAKEHGIEVDIDLFIFVMKKIYGDTNGIVDTVIPSIMSIVDKYISATAKNKSESEVDE